MDPFAELAELAELMESNGGLNHGRRRNRSGKWVPLEPTDFHWHMRPDIHEENPIAAVPNEAPLSVKPLRVTREKETPHGTPSGYSYWACRCKPCKRAWATEIRRQRARKL